MNKLHALIVGMHGAPGEDESGADLPGPFVAAAEELIEAIHASDAGKTAEAFKDLYELCESYEEGDEGEPAPAGRYG